MKLHYYFWVFMPLVFICAYLDNILFGSASVFGYIMICVVEYGLFWIGLYSGYNLRKIDEVKK